MQRPEGGLKESRLIDERNALPAFASALPPLPLLSTRKRRSADDAGEKHEGLSKSDLKRSRKNKDDDQSKLDKRERKRKLIYSPPSTPKRNKKRFKTDDEESGASEQDHQPIVRSTLEHRTTIFGPHDDSSESAFNEQLECSPMNHENRIETSCSLGGDQFCKQDADCGSCSNCTKDDLNLLVVQDPAGGCLAKSRLLGYPPKASLSDDLSEDCPADNCSELSYELVTSKTEDDYLKESFYDVAFSSSISSSTGKPPADELGRKYLKKYEKAKSKKEAKFKSATGKKGKKRKELLSSNLMRKSLKKNSFSYILDVDSSVIFEVMNAHSPFL